MPQTHQVRRARVAESRCYDCGKPAAGFFRGEPCRDRLNKRQRARWVPRAERRPERLPIGPALAAEIAAARAEAASAPLYRGGW